MIFFFSKNRVRPVRLVRFVRRSFWNSFASTLTFHPNVHNTSALFECWTQRHKGTKELYRLWKDIRYVLIIIKFFVFSCFCVPLSFCLTVLTSEKTKRASNQFQGFLFYFLPHLFAGKGEFSYLCSRKSEFMEEVFKTSVIEALQYYVYCLVDPRTNRIFYIGKGSGNRIFNHTNDALNDNLSSLKLPIYRTDR